MDKYHRRKVCEVRVRCWQNDTYGCDWVGEVNELKRHDDSCPKRPWECKYCGLKCTYGDGEGKHWPICVKLPEPCPNMCDVGSVERCNMEQHLSVCPLEPVACEMKEFGCNVVVPRKELARHMRESELQHLTTMTMMNLCLTRQLQQDSTERDRKITQLQQEIANQKKLLTEVQTDLNRKVVRIDEEVKSKIGNKVTELTENISAELTELKDNIQKVQLTTHHIEQHTAGGTCSGSEVFTFTHYSKRKCSATHEDSDPFYTHHRGYKFSLRIRYYSISTNDIGSKLYLMKGEYDDELPWPVTVKVQLELLNQAGDNGHVVRSKELKWRKDKRDTVQNIDNSLMTYPDLERQGGGVEYMMNDYVKFRIHVTVVPD